MMIIECECVNGPMRKEELSWNMKIVTVSSISYNL